MTLVLNMENPYNGLTALMMAIQEGHYSVVKTLLECGAKQLVDNIGFTPLMSAANKGESEILRLLLAHTTTTINVQNTFTGDTALHSAACRGDVEVVKELLCSGAKLNIQDRLLFTPLAVACQENHAVVVKMLLDEGASPLLHNHEGMFPIHLAAARDNLEVMKILLDNELDPNYVSTTMFCVKNLMRTLFARCLV